MKMRTLLIVMAVALLAGCAPKNVGTLALHDTTKSVKTVYVWDADGHTDLKLLRALKAEAESQLRSGGYVVSADPGATEAYVKVTVDDATAGKDGFIRARLYIIDAASRGIIYDKTCEAGSAGEGYPAASFMRCALAEFVSGRGGEG